MKLVLKKGLLSSIIDFLVYDEVYNNELFNDVGIIAYDLFMRKRFLFFKWNNRKIGSIHYDPKKGEYTLVIDKFDSIKRYKTPAFKNPIEILQISFNIAFKGSKELIDIEREKIPIHERRNIKANLNIAEITDQAIDYYLKEMNK